MPFDEDLETSIFMWIAYNETGFLFNLLKYWLSSIYRAEESSERLQIHLQKLLCENIGTIDDNFSEFLDFLTFLKP